MRYLGLIGLLFWLCAGHAAAKIVLCDDAKTDNVIDLRNGPPFSYDMGGYSVKVRAGDHAFSYSANAFPTIFYAYDTHKSFGFFFGYVIDEGGHVSCISLPDDFDMTPERQAFFETFMARNFAPPVFEGKAVRIYQEASVNEEERPPYHVLRPMGEVSSVAIKLDIRGHRSGYSAFSMIIWGNGTVNYIPEQGSDPLLGSQTYHIDPRKVTTMLDLAEKADFWSLREIYRPIPHPDDGPFQEEYFFHVNIAVGNREKDMRIFDWGGNTGESKAAHDLLYQLADLAGIELWHNISRETIDVLAQSGFDFRSSKGGELLIDVTSNANNPDADINMLLALGAPRDYVSSGSYLLVTGLLDAAIDSDRAALVDKLIAGGALLTNGQPDPIKSARALAHAVATVSPDMVARLLPFHPPLVFREATPFKNDTPVISLVGRKGSPAFRDVPDDRRLHDLITVTQQLLDAGAGINDRGSAQLSLLDNAVHEGDIQFVSWLVAHGAKVTSESFVPIISDDITVLLLNTDPELDDDTWHLIAANAEPKTKA